MNVLFLTIGDFDNFEAGSVHIDLVKKISAEGHSVFVACKNENPNCDKVTKEIKNGIELLFIKTGAVKKNANVIMKGISTIKLEDIYIKAIKDNWNSVKFDLVLYHTPPVTFEKVVRYIKRRDGANSYLLLKDIFPQNAVDLGMMKKTGIRGVFYRYFRMKEKRLYKISDYIGCMSPANVEYLLKCNPYLNPSIVEVAPNSVILNQDRNETDINRIKSEGLFFKQKYNLPLDRPIFIYGGNLGKPQGVDYLIKCMDANKDRKDCFFLIIGNGSEFNKLANWSEQVSHNSVGIYKSLPKEEYDILVKCCDIGLIFLDHRFSIPNYPSRLLSYLGNKMPVICATDKSTDVGKIAEENGYGFWCESLKPEDFTALVDRILSSDYKKMGERGYDYLKNHYLVDNTYNAIFNHFLNN